jgi:hypothetical protein
LAGLKSQQLEKQKRIEDIDSRLNEWDLTNRQVASKGFLQDLLSDQKGYSFHRFQIFVWTLFLGIIFATPVYKSLHMPEFNSTLLGLMGLSAGAYVGLKLPEK